MVLGQAWNFEDLKLKSMNDLGNHRIGNNQEEVDGVGVDTVVAFVNVDNGIQNT